MFADLELERLLDESFKRDRETPKPLATAEGVEAVKSLDNDIVAENREILELNELLADIQKVNFHAYFEKYGIDEPKQKHYLVAIIDQLQEIAAAQKWDLVMQDGFVYLFNGRFWQSIPRDALKRFLYQVAIKLGFCEVEAKGYEFVDKLYKQFLTLANFDAPTRNEAVLVNLQNGTFEINGTATLREHRKEDFLTYCLPFAYKADAAAPKFERYLNEVLPDIESQKLLQEFCGYVFTKNLKLEKVLVLFGSGANGKSVFLDILTALLSKENISHYTLSDLGQEHYRALIKDKLINWASEIKSGYADNEDFKKLSSGEAIGARLKYGNAFNMEKYAKLAFNANELPKDVEHNEAYFRRFLIIPFEQTIPEHKRNASLAREIISDELDGVFVWIVEGLKRLLQQGKFSECAKARAALETYKRESDTVAGFIDEHSYAPCTVDRMSRKQLFSQYQEFCKDGGFRSLNINNFSGRLKRLGFESVKSGDFRGFYIKRNI